MNIATNITVLRKEARLTMDDLAYRLNITPEEVMSWERGITKPSPDILPYLCRILRISVEDFLERDIQAERNEALGRMKTSQDRSSFNWYLGSRAKWGFYLAIAVAIPLVLSGLLILLLNEEIQAILGYSDLYSIITAYTTTGGIFGYVICGHIIWENRRLLRWWMIWLIGPVLGFVGLIGIIGLIPYWGYSIYQLIVKRGRN